MIELLYLLSIGILLTFSAIISKEINEDDFFNYLFYISILILISNLFYSFFYIDSSYIGGRFNGYLINSINIGYLSFFIVIYSTYIFINFNNKFILIGSYFGLVISFLTGSRSLILTIFFGIYLLLFNSLNNVYRFIIFLVLMIFSFLVLNYNLPIGFRENYQKPFQDRFQQVERSFLKENNNFINDSDLIKKSSDIKEYLFGLGFSNKNSGEISLNKLDALKTYNIYNDPHNLFIYIYKSVGLFGLFFFLYFIYIMMRKLNSFKFPFYYLLSFSPFLFIGGSFVSIINLSDWLLYISLFYVNKKK